LLRGVGDRPLVPTTRFDVAQTLEHRRVTGLPVRLLGPTDELFGSRLGAGETLSEHLQVHRVVLGVLTVVAESEVDQKDGGLVDPCRVRHVGTDPDVPGRGVAVDESGPVEAGQISGYLLDPRGCHRRPEFAVTDGLDRQLCAFEVDIVDQWGWHARTAGPGSQSRLGACPLTAQPLVEFGVSVRPRVAPLVDRVLPDCHSRLGSFQDRLRITVGVTATGHRGGVVVGPPGDGHLVGPKVGIDTGLLDSECVVGPVHRRAEHGDHSGVVSQEAVLRGEKRRAALFTHRGEHRP
jgi:hypothetical protein